MIVPVIICGGGGTRLWPASRSSYPKPFVNFIGDISSFEAALIRVSDRSIFGAPLIVANEEHRFLVAQACSNVQVNDATLLLEPESRDTAPAITAAALVLQSRDKNAIMLVLAADHVVDDVAEFTNTCVRALERVKLGWIVTVGIKPIEPATGYGYICPIGKMDHSGVRKVSAFKEKPDLATAKRYIAEGYLWNSGNNIMLATTLLEQMQKFEPETVAAVKASVEHASDFWGSIRISKEDFSKAQKNSIDYALMERSDKIEVIEASYRWSDIGNWNAVWTMKEKDSGGNVFIGDIESLDTQNTYIHSPHMLTATIGIRNLAVVVTADVVLIADRSRSEEVKKLVEKVKISHPERVAAPKRGYRPWGYYETLDLGPRYQVKRIVVNQGCKLSLQKHFHRAETWTVVSGSAIVEIDGQRKLVAENESVYIPLGCVHRLENPGRVPLILIEVQCGTYLGEDDIVRLEDIYARN